ncbi:hypothetical protein, partial [Fulvivirga lutimaris]|uniref:hypothetical protein n=1 Tax=Fulvivirga lutimaris TaxID=1819566 RepID=UPI001C875F03
ERLSLKSIFLSLMADYSFGIYFIHFYFILVLRKVNFRLTGEELPNGLFDWILFLLITLGLSVGAIYVMKRLLGKKSRLIIGS